MCIDLHRSHEVNIIVVQGPRRPYSGTGVAAGGASAAAVAAPACSAVSDVCVLLCTYTGAGSASL